MTLKQRNQRLDAILRAYQDGRLSAQAALDAMRLTLGDRRSTRVRDLLESSLFGGHDRVANCSKE